MHSTVPSLCLVCTQTQPLNKELETCGACAIDTYHTPFCVQMSAMECSLGCHCIILRPVLTPDSVRIPEKLIWLPANKIMSQTCLK